MRFFVFYSLFSLFIAFVVFQCFNPALGMILSLEGFSNIAEELKTTRTKLKLEKLVHMIWGLAPVKINPRTADRSL